MATRRADTFRDHMPNLFRIGGCTLQVIPPIGAEGLNRRPPAGACRLFLGPGFRLGARWNRLVETVKTRKKREFSGKKWARYGLKSVNKEGTAGITWLLQIVRAARLGRVAAAREQRRAGDEAV